METRQSYIEAIEALNQEILRMGVHVQEALRKSIDSLREKDSDLAKRVIDEDTAIDRIEIEIEDRCITLIAREQPVATDLRKIVTCLKIAAQLERMGDYARHIAKATLKLIDVPYLKPLVDIPRMAEICIDMIRGILTAFVDEAGDKAVSVSQMDEEVDNLNNQVLREVLTYMMENPNHIEQSITLIFVSRYLERIADRVTNIAEWIIYRKTGQHVELNE